MRTFRNFLIAPAAFIFSIAVSGCSGAYVNAKSISQPSDYPSAIERAKKDKRLFILHSGINVYTVSALEMDPAKQNVHVQLNKLDSVHIVQVTGATNSKKEAAVGEMHFYMKDSVSYLLGEPYTIPLQKMARIDLVGKG